MDIPSFFGFLFHLRLMTMPQTMMLMITTTSTAGIRMMMRSRPSSPFTVAVVGSVKLGSSVASASSDTVTVQLRGFVTSGTITATVLTDVSCWIDATFLQKYKAEPPFFGSDCIHYSSGSCHSCVISDIPGISENLRPCPEPWSSSMGSSTGNKTRGQWKNNQIQGLMFYLCFLSAHDLAKPEMTPFSTDVGQYSNFVGLMYKVWLCIDNEAVILSDFFLCSKEQ